MLTYNIFILLIGSYDAASVGRFLLSEEYNNNFSLDEIDTKEISEALIELQQLIKIISSGSDKGNLSRYEEESKKFVEEFNENHPVTVTIIDGNLSQDDNEPEL